MVSDNSSVNRQWALLIILILSITFFIGVFGNVEIITLCIFFTTFIIISLISSVNNLSARLVTGPLFLVFVGFLFLGQRDSVSVETNSDIKLRSDVKEKITSIKIGSAFGNLVALDKKYSGSGCDTKLIGQDEYEVSSSHSFFVENLSLFNSGKVSRIGAGATASPYSVDFLNSLGKSLGLKQKFNLGIGFYFGHDWNNFGYNLGIWAGEMQIYDDDNADLSVTKLNAAPILTIKIGNKNSFYFSGHVGDDFNYGFYRYFAKWGIGGAFSMKDDHIRYGVGFNERNDLLLDLSFPLSRTWVIEPSIALGDTPIYGIGMRYQVRQSK